MARWASISAPFGLFGTRYFSTSAGMPLEFSHSAISVPSCPYASTPYPPPGQTTTSPVGLSDSTLKSSADGFETFLIIRTLSFFPIQVSSVLAISGSSAALPGILPSGQRSNFSEAAAEAANAAMAAAAKSLISFPRRNCGV